MASSDVFSLEDRKSRDVESMQPPFDKLRVRPFAKNLMLSLSKHE